MEHNYSDRMLEALAWVDRLAEALHHAALRPEPEKRFTGLLAVAQGLAGRGTLTAKDEQRLQEAAKEIADESGSDKALYDLAAALAGWQRFDAAEQVANIIAAKDRWASALAALVEALAQAGQCARAEQLAESFPLFWYPTVRDEHASSEFVPKTRADLWRIVGVCLEGAGESAQAQFDRAEQDARAVESNWHQADALLHLVRAHAEAGRFDRAERLAHTIAMSDRRQKAARELVRALALAGLLDDAEEATMIAAGRAHAGDAIIVGLPEDDPDARASVEAVITGYMRAEVRATLAQALAQLGKFDRAEEIAQSIRASTVWVQVSSEVAAALALARHPDRAQATFDELERFIQTVPDEGLRVSYTRDLGQALVRAGQTGRARKLVTLLDNDQARLNLLAQFVTTACQWGQFDAAAQLASDIPPEQPWRRVEALHTLISGLVRDTQLARAEQVALAIPPGVSVPIEKERAAILCELAIAQAKAGAMDEARALVQQAEQMVGMG